MWWCGFVVVWCGVFFTDNNTTPFCYGLLVVLWQQALFHHDMKYTFTWKTKYLFWWISIPGRPRFFYPSLIPCISCKERTRTNPMPEPAQFLSPLFFLISGLGYHYVPPYCAPSLLQIILIFLYSKYSPSYGNLLTCYGDIISNGSFTILRNLYAINPSEFISSWNGWAQLSEQSQSQNVGPRNF